MTCRVAPRLGLVRALGQSQTETFRKVLETARERLLQMIPTLPQDRLELLVSCSDVVVPQPSPRLLWSDRRPLIGRS